MRVQQAAGGHDGQSQYPGRGLRQRVVDDAEGAVQRPGGGGLAVGGRYGGQRLVQIGQRGLGPGGEPAAGQYQRGGLPGALLGDGLGGARIDGDPGGPGVTGEQFDGGRGVQAAQGARPDIGDAGQRPLGDDHDQAVRGVREQRLDLFGARGVVQEEQRTAAGEGAAQQFAQLVQGGAGRGGGAERIEQLAGDDLGGGRFAVPAGEGGAQHPVGVVGGELAQQGLGQRGTAGAGAAGDQQDAAAGAPAAGEGVQAGAFDVGAQRLELAAAAGDPGGRGRGGGRGDGDGAVPAGPRCPPGRRGRSAPGRPVPRLRRELPAAHRLIRHRPRSCPAARTSPPHSAAGTVPSVVHDPSPAALSGAVGHSIGTADHQTGG